MTKIRVLDLNADDISCDRVLMVYRQCWSGDEILYMVNERIIEVDSEASKESLHEKYPIFERDGIISVRRSTKSGVIYECFTAGCDDVIPTMVRLMFPHSSVKWMSTHRIDAKVMRVAYCLWLIGFQALPYFDARSFRAFGVEFPYYRVALSVKGRCELLFGTSSINEWCICVTFGMMKNYRVDSKAYREFHRNPDNRIELPVSPPPAYESFDRL